MPAAHRCGAPAPCTPACPPHPPTRQKESQMDRETCLGLSSTEPDPPAACLQLQRPSAGNAFCRETPPTPKMHAEKRPKLMSCMHHRGVQCFRLVCFALFQERGSQPLLPLSSKVCILAGAQPAMEKPGSSSYETLGQPFHPGSPVGFWVPGKVFSTAQGLCSSLTSCPSSGCCFPTILMPI